MIHPVGTTLFYCLKRQELSSKQNRSSSYLSDTLLLIQTHTLSLSVFSSQHPSPSSSLSQSLSSLSRNFTSLFSPFKSPPSPTHSVIILYVFSPSTCHLCILVLLFSKPPLRQTDTHASFSPDVFGFLLSRMFGTPAGKQWGLEPSNNIRGYMPYGHPQGDCFLFLFLPVFPSLAAKEKRPKESRRKTSSPAPVRSLTTEDSSEVCVDIIWKIPANVKLVHGWGGGGKRDVVCGMRISQCQWRWAVKTNNYLTFHITGEVYSWKIKLSGEGGENGVVWLRLGESYPKLDEISLCVRTTGVIV